MRAREQWVWLPVSRYPDRQNTTLSHTSDESSFIVAELCRTYDFGKSVKFMEIRFSGDTVYRLYLNGKFLARGPAHGGGDFLPDNKRIPPYYATQMALTPAEYPELRTGKITFGAVVRMLPMTEYSRGHGGFCLDGRIVFEDGTKTVFATDETWKIRLLTSYPKRHVYDETLAAEPWTACESCHNIWYTETAPIPSCTEEILWAENGTKISVPPHTSLSVQCPLPMVYAGYLTAQAQTNGSTVHIHMTAGEQAANQYTDEITFCSKDISFFEDTEMSSVGFLAAEISNDGEQTAVVSVGLTLVSYPVTEVAKTVTSDEDLNLVLDVCTHSLRYCRQSYHLDSPRHQEPLACTGDYYIESLMTAFSFGDMRLAAFDVRRTAELLRYHDGRMFHTTYSLIWVQMLWDVYKLTGERKLLLDCADAMISLFERFRTYLGENGLIETPPDYMFIDWLNPDGINTHHPPKALGQTCLCMFYYGALETAAKIWEEINVFPMAKIYRTDKENLRKAMLENLWDSERGLFFEGLNTPTDEKLLYTYMPQNVEKRYYRKHANILAAYFGFFDEAQNQSLLDKVMTDKTLGEVQPYFMHFLLDAVYRNGLREKYTLPLLEEWKEPVRTFPKGLPEGFHKPTPTYGFDHSHAWGGTPAYALPLALSGLEIVEAGYQKIRLSPSLLGLQSATVEIPTPYGQIRLAMKAGEKTEISVPQGIELAE